MSIPMLCCDVAIYILDIQYLKQWILYKGSLMATQLIDLKTHYVCSSHYCKDDHFVSIKNNRKTSNDAIS